MKIAICGKMCSGKTTLANTIMRMDSRYKRYSFGQKIKDLATELFDMKDKDRTLLTTFATSMRDIKSDVWIQYLLRQIKDNDFCIIDDVRYQDEIDQLIKDKWTIIQLQISDSLQEHRLKRLYPHSYQDHLKNKTHISELNAIQYPDGYPHYTFDMDTMKNEKLNHEIFLLLQK
jgi:hypothetical protein